MIGLLGANHAIYLLLRLILCSRVHQHHDEESQEDRHHLRYMDHCKLCSRLYVIKERTVSLKKLRRCVQPSMDASGSRRCSG